MKKSLILLIFLPVLAFGQFRVGGGGGGSSTLDMSTLLPIIADSTLWHLQGTDTLVTDGALPVKVSGLRVSGTTRLDGTLTMVTTTGEQVQLGTGSDAAPELSSAGDTNTGIRFPGSDVTTFVQGAREKMRIASTGNVTIGGTGGYDRLGVLNSSSGQGTGFGLTSSQWNKGRTSWATSRDTSAIGFYIDSAGGPRWFMRAVDGDSLGIALDGSYSYFTSKKNGIFKFGDGSGVLYLNGQIVPTTNDAKSIGTPNLGYRFIYGTDNIYLGGKGQTATMYISKEATVAGQDSSITMKIGSDSNPYVRYAAADGDSARIHVRSDSTEFYSKNALVLDAPAVLIGASNVGISKMDTVFTAGYVPRWVKFTSGAKSWYSPVYADTTGKW